MLFRSLIGRPVWSLLLLALGVCSLGAGAQAPAVPADMGVKYTDVAKTAGITGRTIYGDEHKNRYLFETTGSGAAFIDFDNDGDLDVFLVTGTRIDPLPASEANTNTNRLYRNNGDGTFTDVTVKAGLVRAEPPRK